MASVSTNAAPVATPEIGKTLRIGNVVTNYHDAGSGDAVLLIHGSGPGVTAWANWRLIIPELAKHARVIAPDMAGFGYTQAPDAADTTVEGWVRQLVDLLDALKLPKVSIIGNSFGGAIALHFAHRFPARVAKMVLMGAVGVSFPISEGLDKVWGYQPSLEAMRDILNIFAFNRAIITDDLIAMRYRASIRDDVQERFARLFPAPRQRWVDALALDEASIRAIATPTLVIHGRDDQVIPLAVSQKLASLLPHVTYFPIAECGHWVQIEQTQKFLGAVEGFLFA